MPIRLVICPVVEIKGTRMSKVATIPDPSVPPYEIPVFDDDGNLVMTELRKTYGQTSVISDGLPGQLNNWCLSFVRGGDFSALDLDPHVVNLIEEDYRDGDNRLARTVRDLRWSPTKIQRVRQRLEDYDIDTSELTLDTPLWKIVRAVGRKIWPNFTPKGMLWMAKNLWEELANLVEETDPELVWSKALQLTGRPLQPSKEWRSRVVRDMIDELRGASS